MKKERDWQLDADESVRSFARPAGSFEDYDKLPRPRVTQLSLRAYLHFLFDRLAPLRTDTSCEGQRRETKTASATTAAAEAVVDVAVLTQAQFPTEGVRRMVEVCVACGQGSGSATLLSRCAVNMC